MTIRLGRMTIARSIGEFIVGIIALALLACAMMVMIDERCSKDLDGNDIVWDELDPAIRESVIHQKNHAEGVNERVGIGRLGGGGRGGRGGGVVPPPIP